MAAASKAGAGAGAARGPGAGASPGASPGIAAGATAVTAASAEQHGDFELRAMIQIRVQSGAERQVLTGVACLQCLPTESTVRSQQTRSHGFFCTYSTALRKT